MSIDTMTAVGWEHAIAELGERAENYYGVVLGAVAAVAGVWETRAEREGDVELAEVAAGVWGALVAGDDIVEAVACIVLDAALVRELVVEVDARVDRRMRELGRGARRPDYRRNDERPPSLSW